MESYEKDHSESGWAHLVGKLLIPFYPESGKVVLPDPYESLVYSVIFLQFGFTSFVLHIQSASKPERSVLRSLANAAAPNAPAPPTWHSVHTSTPIGVLVSRYLKWTAWIALILQAVLYLYLRRQQNFNKNPAIIMSEIFLIFRVVITMLLTILEHYQLHKAAKLMSLITLTLKCFIVGARRFKVRTVDLVVILSVVCMCFTIGVISL